MAKYKTVLAGLKKYRPVNQRSLVQSGDRAMQKIISFSKEKTPSLRAIGFPNFYRYWMELTYEGVMDIFEKKTFHKLYDSYQISKFISLRQIEQLELGESVVNYVIIYYSLYFRLYFKNTIEVDKSLQICSILEKYLETEDNYHKMYGEIEEFEFYKMLIQLYNDPKNIKLFCTKYKTTIENLVETVELRFWERVNTDGDINSANIMPILPLQIMALVSVMEKHGFEIDTNTDLLKKYFPFPEQSFNVTDEHAIKFIEILKKIEIEIEVENKEIVKFEYNL